MEFDFTIVLHGKLDQKMDKIRISIANKMVLETAHCGTDSNFKHSNFELKFHHWFFTQHLRIFMGALWEIYWSYIFGPPYCSLIKKLARIIYGIECPNRVTIPKIHAKSERKCSTKSVWVSSVNLASFLCIIHTFFVIVHVFY